jgi:thioesterase domain-containing protein
VSEMDPDVPLPTLYSIRGWTEPVNPAYVTFVEEMRSTGIDVVDIYVPPKGFGDLGQWAGAVLDRIRGEMDPSVPLHLMTYCIGGNLSLAMLHQIESEGVPIEFVAFIDVREDPEAYRLARGIDSLYLVPWAVRFRLLLVRLTPPDRETLGPVVASVLRRSVRSVIELPKRGWRSRRRRAPATFDEQHLTYHWEFDAISIPVRLYNTQSSIDRFATRDPSLNIGKFLQGGFVIRFINGSHENCIDPPHSTELIETMTSDRRAVVAGSDMFR